MDSIKEIKRWALDVSGEWNGDESGKEEDMAVIANEILDIIEELEDYVGHLKELDNGFGPTEDEDRGYEQGS